MRWHLISVAFYIFYIFGVCHGEQDKFRQNLDTFERADFYDTGHVISARQVTINSSEGLNNTVTNGGRFFDNSSTVTERAVVPEKRNKTRPLDDLSLDDVPMFMNITGISMPIPRPTKNVTTTTTPPPQVLTCIDGTRQYKIGDRFNMGCNETCECGDGGKIICEARCKPPLQAKGLAKRDEFCREMPSDDECCVILQCTHDTETESLESCVHKNQTFHRGEMFNDGCEAVCSCESDGKIKCKPRCPQIAKNSAEQCVQVPDPADPCCTVVLCDVTLGDQDVSKMGTEETPKDSSLRLKSADALNSTSAIVHFLGEPELESNLTAEISEDQIKWNKTELDGVVVHNLKPGKTYFIRVISGGAVSNAVSITLPKSTPNIFFSTEKPEATHEALKKNETMENMKEGESQNEFCEFKGRNHTIGEEFNDGCVSYCICTETGVDCSPIECPSEFGLDLLDPTCIKWETKPKDFNPVPPKCCPDKVRCLDNGSCKFMGETYPNWAEIPPKISGCEKRCYCEYGNVTCQEVCPPVPATPPSDLPCSPQQATLHHLPGDDCCLYWICPQIQHPSGAGQPHGFPALPGQGHEMQNGIIVQVLEPLDEHTVRLAFSVPPLLVGLHGRVEVRYTADKHNQDPSTWELQVLAPPGDLIATPQLHFDLGYLLPDTTYSIIIKIILRELSNMPQSPVLTVKTLPASNPTSTLPHQIPVNPDMSVDEVNSTWARFNWRKFTDFELQFIDGIQIHYKGADDKVFESTPMLHRLITSYTIEGLKPNTTYLVKMVFVPYPGQATELQSVRGLDVHTASDNDGYGFEINLEVLTTKSSSVEITWSGVPYPEDKYINIYRILYKSESGKEDSSSFKVAKRDSIPKVMLTDLKPITRYTVWLEAYLTNGRLKKSVSKEFVTKPGAAQTVTPSFQGKLSGTPPLMEPGDYYGPLVAVSILAALAIMAALILLLVLMKRHGQNKAAISSRTTQSAYDNPSYKTCETDQPLPTANGGATLNGTLVTTHS